jgi:hypothetical protein
VCGERAADAITGAAANVLATQDACDGAGIGIGVGRDH